MFLSKLQLHNFKNYSELIISEFGPVNVLVGKNGSGKTNFLDAIHFLSLTKSAFSSGDNFSAKQGERSFFIKGEVRRNDKSNEILCSYQSGVKKIKEGGVEYEKLSDHIGKYPVVLIAPDDTLLVREGSEERRKFFDTILSQLDRTYLSALIRYSAALKNRNAALKMFADQNRVDELVLESFDIILIETGTLIHKRRVEFTREFTPYFNQYHGLIVSREDVALNYESELNHKAYQAGLNAAREKDLFLQRTTFGVHRDDYHFTLGNDDLKKLGSQGQQKSFVIALKLAQFQIMSDHKSFKPILLLDDIFDKLDDERIGNLLSLIKQDKFGQIFITDARPDRSARLLQDTAVPAKLFLVENGTISALSA